MFWRTMGTGPMGIEINAPMAIRATHKDEYTVILSWVDEFMSLIPLLKFNVKPYV
jgi:hypothetical protein